MLKVCLPTVFLQGPKKEEKTSGIGRLEIKEQDTCDATQKQKE